MKTRIATAAMLLLVFCAIANAADLVPFRGTWHGQTISAVFQPPHIVFVIASGTGQVTHLGDMTMVSPHYNRITDFALWGEQIFTAADGSTVHATFSGQLTPTPEGNVVGVVPCTIDGGTGRFAGATGSYSFSIVARPLPNGVGFDSTATFDGVISSVGSTK